jgi:hypothetical protein
MDGCNNGHRDDNRLLWSLMEWHIL